MPRILVARCDPEDRVGPHERGHVEARVGRAAQLRIGAEQLELERVGHGDAGILQQGRDVIGRVADHRVLEVDDADAGEALALRQPDQVRRMEVAQAPGRGLRQDLVEQAREGGHEGRPRPLAGTATLATDGAYQSITSSASISRASRS